MEIFGKHIFGDDAEQWLKLCKESKREWILKNTNQTDNNLIDEFINNPKISKECKCLDCGKNGNISKKIPTETTAVIVDNSIATNSGGGNYKRGKGVKGT